MKERKRELADGKEMDFGSVRRRRGENYGWLERAGCEKREREDGKGDLADERLDGKGELAGGGGAASPKPKEKTMPL